jgi:haloalkane dehalogenase
MAVSTLGMKQPFFYTSKTCIFTISIFPKLLKMKILRTPDECFSSLKDYPFSPNYVMIDDLRLHYVDEGNPSGKVILLMHGEPTWSYLYRKIIPILVEQGYRVIAPDLIGFGKSDKPSEFTDYSYKNHVDCIEKFIQILDLKDIVLFCQDWGGLIGLRVVAENQERFRGVIASNTGLPTGDQPPSEAFKQWQEFSQTIPIFPTGNIVSGGSFTPLSAEETAAYDAPFPEEKYKAAARIFPKLVPTTPDDPASEDNRKAWMNLMNWQKPFITCFSDSDPITKGGDMVLQGIIPGTKGQSHTTIEKAGHFVQEDKPEEIAQIISEFMQKNFQD